VPPRGSDHHRAENKRTSSEWLAVTEIRPLRYDCALELLLATPCFDIITWLFQSQQRAIVRVRTLNT
jgi:hypothetical protein